MIIRDATKNDAHGIAQVHVSSWQTSYKGIMPDKAIAARPLEKRQAIWTGILAKENHNTILLVAEENQKIVGFANGGKPQEAVDGFDSELYAIYLLKTAQGKGIGRQLMQTFAKRLVDKGYKSMLLWVLQNNQKSRGFYETMGGILVAEGVYRVTQDATLITVAYGWKDIRRLVIES